MMVDEQLAGRGITDGRVLEAMGHVPRELFVTDRDRRKAYRDMPLRIGFGQTISQPYMVAVICQAAEVREGDRVLDIGTGSGYQAAVLAELGAQVYTVERIPDLAARARERLAEAGYESVAVHVGDGSLGLPSTGPTTRSWLRRCAGHAGIPVRRAARPGAARRAGGGAGRAAPRGDRPEPGGPGGARSVPCRFVPLVGAEGF